MATRTLSRVTLTAALMLSTMTPSEAAATKDPCRRYVDLARTIGWPKSERANIRRIMWRESRCRPTAHNTADPTRYGSRGLMQINGTNLGWATRMGYVRNADDLFDPRRNLKVALELWRLYGWRPWAGSSSAP